MADIRDYTTEIKPGNDATQITYVRAIPVAMPWETARKRLNPLLPEYLR